MHSLDWVKIPLVSAVGGKTDMFLMRNLVEGVSSVPDRTASEKLCISEELLWGPGDKVCHRGGEQFTFCTLLHGSWLCFGSYRIEGIEYFLRRQMSWL